MKIQATKVQSVVLFMQYAHANKFCRMYVVNVCITTCTKMLSLDFCLVSNTSEDQNSLWCKYKNIPLVTTYKYVLFPLPGGNRCTPLTVELIETPLLDTHPPLDSVPTEFISLLMDGPYIKRSFQPRFEPTWHPLLFNYLRNC